MLSEWFRFFRWRFSASGEKSSDCFLITENANITKGLDYSRCIEQNQQHSHLFLIILVWFKRLILMNSQSKWSKCKSSKWFGSIFCCWNEVSLSMTFVGTTKKEIFQILFTEEYSRAFLFVYVVLLPFIWMSFQTIYIKNKI